MAAVDAAIASVILLVPGVIVWYVGRPLAGKRTDGSATDIGRVALVWGIVANLLFVLGLRGVGTEADAAAVLAGVYALDPLFIGGWLLAAILMAFAYSLALIYRLPQRMRAIFQRTQTIERYTEPEWTRFFDTTDYVRVYLTEDAGASPIAGNVKAYSSSETDRELVLTNPWQWNSETKLFDPIVATRDDPEAVSPGSRILLPERQIKYVVKVPPPKEPDADAVVMAVTEAESDADAEGTVETDGDAPPAPKAAAELELEDDARSGVSA